MVNNSTNINKTNNHLSPQIIDHNKSPWNMMLESRYWLGQVQKFTSLLYTGILSYYFMSQGYLWLTLYNCWVYISTPLVHISTKGVILIPVHGEVYLIQHYVIKLSVICDRSVVFSGYSTNKTDCHDITEILLKVALITLIVSRENKSLSNIVCVLTHYFLV